MKKRILTLLCILCTALALCSCTVTGNPIPEGMDEAAVLAAGEEIISDLNEGNWQEIFDQLREDAQASTGSPAAIQAHMESVLAKVGPFEKLKDTRANRAAIITSVILIAAIAVIISVTVANNRSKQNDEPIAKPSTTQKGEVTTKAPTTTAAPETEPPAATSPRPVEDKLPSFSLPVSGVLSKKHSVDTQVFSPTLGEYRVHLGIDIATEEAAPVCAMAAGTVAQIWEDPMMGWSLALSHTGDAVTVYKNLSKQFAEGIAVGAEVEAGQLLGSVGDTAMIEIAEEPHLHVEMTVKGLQVDPLEYFSKDVLSALTEDSIYESEADK